ncbi:hypothetical protein AWU82_28000 [Pseudomonas glycinae]|uniref:Uncharacterized protein n=1 Tax=Pseudomonas glycinae TaxID=1785145 RepID=A0ABM6QHB4_9PSED|nr:hypothetical protein AWU82_28000 [Pseudomonas glycinae]
MFIDNNGLIAGKSSRRTAAPTRSAACTKPVGAGLPAIASEQTPASINAGACGTSTGPFSRCPGARRCLSR